jgi:hypothetical protein
MHDEYALSFTVAIETTKMAVRRNVWEDIKHVSMLVCGEHKIETTSNNQ